MLEINTILHTRDGRKIGNAIIVSITDKTYHIVTDYGNKCSCNLKEIKELFYIQKKTDDEYLNYCRSTHKHYTPC